LVLGGELNKIRLSLMDSIDDMLIV
jgi:hypothetical protein